jgi:5-formyltetrahydrofolate cyclo-ligase
MVDPGRQKLELRRALLARRRAIPEDKSRALSAEVCARLEAWLRARGALRVGLYWPHRGEPDLRGLAGLRAAGMMLALPVVDAVGHAMHFYEWRAATPMRPNRFGIPEPDPALAPRVDLGPLTAAPPAVVLVPAVALDPAGRRLGYGGGYYDRFLAAGVGAVGAPETVGVAFAAFVVPCLPEEPHDRPLRFVATETSVGEARHRADVRLR